MGNRAKVFYSYSHKDEAYKNSLVTHLTILKRIELIDDWHDRKILPGADWGGEISGNLLDSDVIILLVSSDFIASEYCYCKEMSTAIEMHESKQSIVIPVIIRPCEWGESPIGSIQALPKDVKPISTWGNEDEAWLDVVSGIKSVVKNVNKGIQRKKAKISLKTMRDMLIGEVERVDHMFSKDKEYSGSSTGLSDLDEILNGINSDDFILVASRPSMGKTNFLIRIVEEYSISPENLDCNVGFLSCHLGSDKITQRLISSIGRIPIGRVRSGQLDEHDWPRFNSAISMLVETKILMEDKPSFTLEEIELTIKELVKKGDKNMLVIDEIQHISPEKDKGVDYISNALRVLSKKYCIKIVAALTLPRKLEGRPNKRPIPTDLGKYNSYYESVDKLLFLYRDEAYNEESVDCGIVEINVAKNTNGETGTTRTLYSPDICKFENLVDVSH